MIRLGIVGATGKMGQVVLQKALADPNFIVCSILCSPQSKKLGQISPISSELIYKDFCDEDVDVVIDFSTPEGLYKAVCIKKPLICGTTNFSEKEYKFLQDLSKQVPVLYSPNFSLGMALFFSLMKQCKNHRENFIHIALCEKHSKTKQDMPSGSALEIAKILNISKEEIQSERVEETIFQHQIEFFFLKEKVCIQHEAISRDCFALGALSAAKFLFKKPPGMYQLADLWS